MYDWPLYLYLTLAGSSVLGFWAGLRFARKKVGKPAAADAFRKGYQVAQTDRDLEWFQIIESLMGFHPVSMTDALDSGIAWVKKRGARLREIKNACGEVFELLEFHDGSEEVPRDGMEPQILINALDFAKALTALRDVLDQPEMEAYEGCLTCGLPFFNPTDPSLDGAEICDGRCPPS